MAQEGHPFGYTGRRWFTDLGLYYYRARWYDPELGTFLETDPIGQLDYINLYSYVGLNPLNATDPSGRDSCGGGYVDAMDNWYGGGSCPGYDYSPLSHPKTTASVLAAPITAAAAPGLISWAIINAPQIAMVGELVITGYTPAGASVLTIGAVATKAGVNISQMSSIIKAQGNELKGTQRVIAGAGLGGKPKPIGDIDRITKTYGGAETDWSKVKSTNTKFQNGVSIETHAYRNNATGQVVEPKVKIQEPLPPTPSN